METTLFTCERCGWTGPRPMLRFMLLCPFNGDVREICPECFSKRQKVEWIAVRHIAPRPEFFRIRNEGRRFSPKEAARLLNFPEEMCNFLFRQ